MNEPNEIGRTESGRRTFIKRAAYIAPAVLTLSAVSSFAKAGSDKCVRPPLGVGGGVGPPTCPPGLNK
jgi:hypothetical protein